jgi:hypothetical protein
VNEILAWQELDRFELERRILIEVTGLVFTRRFGAQVPRWAALLGAAPAVPALLNWLCTWQQENAS